MISRHHQSLRAFRNGQKSFITGLSCHALIDHFAVAVRGFRDENIIDFLLMITDNITIKFTIAFLIIGRDIYAVLSFKLNLTLSNFIYINIQSFSSFSNFI